IAGVHDRRPLSDVVDDARAEFVGGRGPRIVAERAQALDHRRLLENGDDLRVQAIDNRRRNARGREQTLPTRHHVARNTGVGDGPAAPPGARLGPWGGAKVRAPPVTASARSLPSLTNSMSAAAGSIMKSRRLPTRSSAAGALPR